MAKVVTTINYPAIDKILNSPSGEVGRDLKRRADRIRNAAKLKVGVKTGRLRRSIRVYGHRRTALGQKIQIGTSVPYALMHHNGTKPHIITPNNHRFLKFKPSTGASKGWNVLADGSVLARKVRHPGTKPNRYLSDSVKYIRT
jgi:hypothetical protein